MKLFLLAILMFLVSWPSYAMERAYGWCEQGNKKILSIGDITKVQQSFPGCTVTVYLAGTLTPATLFADAGGTQPLSNPFTGATNGYWFFYAADGHYDAKLSGSGIPVPFTLGDIQLGATGGGGGGGSGCGASNPSDPVCQINEGGTSATTAPNATHNLQFLANASTPSTPFTGAVARPDDYKLADRISVADFGADSTGTNDSSAAFNATLTAASQRTGTGVYAYIPCGAYKLNSTVNISKVGQSLVGENKACVSLTYTGTATAIQDVIAPDIPAAGEIGNFALHLPNATSSTVGIWSHTQAGYYHNILIDTCSAATGVLINNGLTTNQPAPLDVSYNENNVWIDVTTDKCNKGFYLANNGTAPVPDYMFMGYNKFLNIRTAVDLGQTGFELANGPMFFNSTLDLTCNVSNFNVVSGDVACIKSDGYWSANTINVNGEYNDQGGNPGNAYSVWVTSGGMFNNLASTLLVRHLNSGQPPTNYLGAPLPIRNDQSTAAAILNNHFISGAIQFNTTGTQPTCNAANRGLVWTIFGTAGVADSQQQCIKNSVEAYVWQAVGTGGGGSGTVTLTGDVLGSGTGTVPTSVATVGGANASNIALVANAFANPNAANTVPKLSSAGRLVPSVSSGATGDVTAPAGSIVFTLSASGVTPGTYPKVTVDSKGRVTAGSSLVIADIPTGYDYNNLINKPPNTLPTCTSQFLFYNGTGTLVCSDGTTAAPTTMNYTATGVTSPNTVTVQLKLDQTLTLGVDAGTCNGTADDTLALTHLSALATIVRLKPNTTCRIHNPTITAHTYLIGGSGSVLKNIGSATGEGMMALSSLIDVKLQDLTFDINGADFSTAAPNAALYVNSSADVALENVAFINSGTQNPDTAAVVSFNSEVDIDRPYSNLHGPGFVNDADYSSNHYRLHNGHIDGSQANAVVLHNTGGSSGTCNAEVFGMLIENQGDAFIGSGDEGQNGNAISIDRCNGTHIHHNTIKSVEFSCWRIFGTNTINNLIDHDVCDGSRESAGYAEFGAINNTFDHNVITNYFGGLNDTNVASRSPDGWNYYTNNTFSNGADRAISCEECFATGNTVDGAPYGIQVGHGSDTHGSVVTNNSCRNIDICIVGDTSVGGAQTISGNHSYGTPTIAHLFPSATPNGVSVTGVDLGATTTIHYTGTPSILNGMTVCFSSFNNNGPHQLNSQCAVTSSSTTSQFNVAINSTAYTPWTSPTGSRVDGWVTTVYSSGTTPAYTFTANTTVTNDTIKLNSIGNLGNGSFVWIPDAAPNSASCIAGTGGAWATRANGAWTCGGGGGGGGTPGGSDTQVQVNCAGAFCGYAGYTFNSTTNQVSATGGFKSNGATSGQLILGDSTSGFSVTTTPISGLSQAYTLKIPQPASSTSSAIGLVNLTPLTTSNLSWGTGAGTSSPSAVTVTGNNSHFDLNFTTSSGPVSGTIATVTFSTAFSTAPVCRVQSQGRAITGLDRTAGTTALSITDTSALAASTAYKVSVDCYTTN